MEKILLKDWIHLDFETYNHPIESLLNAQVIHDFSLCSIEFMWAFNTFFKAKNIYNYCIININNKRYIVAFNENPKGWNYYFRRTNKDIEEKIKRFIREDRLLE